jgi:hypothetical protein
VHFATKHAREGRGAAVNDVQFEWREGARRRGRRSFESKANACAAVCLCGASSLTLRRVALQALEIAHEAAASRCRHLLTCSSVLDCLEFGTCACCE